MPPSPSSLLVGRRFCCASGFGPRGKKGLEDNVFSKKRLVVAVNVLGKIMDASQAADSIFELAAIVTQPPSARLRGRRQLPSPVAEHALDSGFPHHLIFTPEKAGEENFLADLRALRPDVCITAAYGNILPRRFLEIPQCGTLNIHPSLLPLYRGAAPVQRALQDGVKETGVSLAYTVRALDAGPVIAKEKLEVDDHIKAPELLSILFHRGSNLLLGKLPSILDGSAMEKAEKQDDALATLAPKVRSEESWMNFDQEALVLHNKVRAFAGWPGTRAKIQVVDNNQKINTIELKIITTRVGIPHNNDSNCKHDEMCIFFDGEALVVPCANNSLLQVLELQLPGKKAVTAKAFWNGLRGQQLLKSP
ncbi:Methionyl-tRNA formyltransferase [Nymphaea thermarum]|nr:Methionyl-tRNA formyltransferase [Nymphaea thermarum]